MPDPTEPPAEYIRRPVAPHKVSVRAKTYYIVIVNGEFHLCRRDWGWAPCFKGWPGIKAPAYERNHPHPVVAAFFRD